VGDPNDAARQGLSRSCARAPQTAYMMPGRWSDGTNGERASHICTGGRICARDPDAWSRSTFAGYSNAGVARAA
jgi:hypothetical protein